MVETRPIGAAFSVLAAMALIGLIDNFIVVIAERHGLWQFQLVRTVMALPMIYAASRLGFGTMRPVSWRKLGIRSFFVSCAMVLYFGSLAFLPISEVAAGLFTSPIWVLLISVAFLGQRVGPVRIFAAVAGFIGVVLVLRPDTGALSTYALVPVAAGLFYATGSIMTREWCANESALAVLTLNFVALALWGVVAIAVLSAFSVTVPEGPEAFILRVWVAPDARFLWLVAAQALGSMIGVWLLIRGYQLAETSFVSVFEFSLLIFVTVWAYVLRGEMLDLWAAAGIVLIIASGTAIVLRGR